MDLFWQIAAIITITIVRGGGIITFFMARAGLISFDCFVLIAYLSIALLYFDALLREKEKKHEKNR